jgi:hypothetical protein
MGGLEFVLLIIGSVFVLVVLGALISFVVRMFKTNRPDRPKRGPGKMKGPGKTGRRR